MTGKPVVLTFIGSYLPGYKAGGPIRSVANLVANLGEEIDFRILTRDRDLGDDAPYADVATGSWLQVGQGQVQYLGPRLQSLFSVARIVRATPHDTLYLNSFFSPGFTIIPLVARRLGMIPKRPLVIAPRGEFSAGALGLKARKKRLYLACAKALGLISAAAWKASSPHEAEDIRRVLDVPTDRIHIAVDLPQRLADTPPAHQPRAADAPLRAIFLGRVSPMKNLDYALEALAHVRSPVAFSIYGPAEDVAYATECRRISADLPVHVTVDWVGPVEPAEVPGIMADNDLFFLPTRGENFGHVIAEALGAGTPVLIADTTPWRGLSDLGVGEDLPLADPVAFAAAIDRQAALSPEQAIEKRAQTFAYARQRQREGADVEANRRLFAALHESG